MIIKKFIAALFALFLLLAFVLPTIHAELAENIVVKINGEIVDEKVVLTAGETLDVGIVFVASTDEKDVKAKIWIEGYREKIEAETERFDVYANKTYIKKLLLKLPSDLSDSEDYAFVVRIASKTKEEQKKFLLLVQRPSYNLKILSADFVKKIDAGKDLTINVVVKNRGSHRIDDVYVKAILPELGIEKKVYMGDLVSIDTAEKEDTAEKTLSLHIPETTKSNVYTLKIIAYDENIQDIFESKIEIEGIKEKAREVEVVTAETAKELQAGSEAVYQLTLLNLGKKPTVVTIATDTFGLEKKGISVETEPKIITIPPESTEDVKIKIKTTNQTQEGNYKINVNIGEEGKEIKEVGITANVVKQLKQEKGTKNAAILTIVLSIIFIVLIVVLLVSVKKPKPPAEAEETVYY